MSDEAYQMFEMPGSENISNNQKLPKDKVAPPCIHTAHCKRMCDAYYAYYAYYAYFRDKLVITQADFQQFSSSLLSRK